jgi:hypothetical protein
LDAAVTPPSLPARALAFLGVERSERRSVGLMTAHSFIPSASASARRPPARARSTVGAAELSFDAFARVMTRDS